MFRTKLCVLLTLFLCYFYNSNSFTIDITLPHIPSPTEVIHKVRNKVHDWVGDLKNISHRIARPFENLVNITSNVTGPEFEWPTNFTNATGPIQRPLQTAYNAAPRTSYATFQQANTALNHKLRNLHVLMTRYQTNIRKCLNASGEPYYYMMSFLNRITITEIQVDVLNLNYALVPFNRMIDLRNMTGPPCRYIFPTILDADGIRHSFPNGFSLQNGEIVNPNGVPVGEAPIYSPVPGSGGSMLQDPIGRTYQLATCYRIGPDGSLLNSVTNQPVALPQEWCIDLGGITYLQGGNIIGTINGAVPISGSFSPQSSISLS